MEQSRTPRALLFRRVLAAFLCLSLCLQNSAYALRPQLDRSGLEERLTAGLEEDKEDKEIEQLVELVSKIVPVKSIFGDPHGRPGKHRLGQFLQVKEAKSLRVFMGLVRNYRAEQTRRERNPDKDWGPLQKVDTRNTRKILAQLEGRANSAFSEQGPRREDLPLFARQLIHLSGLSPELSVFYPRVKETDLAQFASLHLDRGTRKISPERRGQLYEQAAGKIKHKLLWPWVREMVPWYFEDRFSRKVVRAPEEDSNELPEEVVNQAFDDIEAAIRRLPQYQTILKTPQSLVKVSTQLKTAPKPSVPSGQRLPTPKKSRREIANEWGRASSALLRALIKAAPPGVNLLVGQGTRIEVKRNGRLAKKIPAQELIDWVENPGANWHGLLVEKVDKKKGTIELVTASTNISGGRPDDPANVNRLPEISQDLISLAADTKFLTRLWEPLTSAGLEETQDAAKILRLAFVRNGQIDSRIAPFLEAQDTLENEDVRWVKAFLALMVASSPSVGETALPPLSVSEYHAGPFSRNEIPEETLRDYVETEWISALEKILQAAAEQITRQQPASPVTDEDLGLKQIQSLMRNLTYAEDNAGQRLFPNISESEVYRWAYRDLPRLLAPLIAPEVSKTFVPPEFLAKALANPLNFSNESGNRAAARAIRSLLQNQPQTFTDDPVKLKRNPRKNLLPWLRLAIALNLVDYSRPAFAGEMSQAGGVMQYVLPRLETPFLDALGGERFINSFIADISKPNQVLVHIPDNNAEIAGSLKLAEVLLSAKPTLSILMIVKADNGVMNDASMEDARRLLEAQLIYEKLRVYQKEGRFQLIPGARSHGTPLNQLTPEAVEALRKSDLVLSEGEANTWNLNGLDKKIYLGLRLKWRTGVENIFGVNPDPALPPVFIKINGMRGPYYQNPFGTLPNVQRVTIRQTLLAQNPNMAAGLEESLEELETRGRTVVNGTDVLANFLGGTEYRHLKKHFSISVKQTPPKEKGARVALNPAETGLTLETLERRKQAYERGAVELETLPLLPKAILVYFGENRLRHTYPEPSKETLRKFLNKAWDQKTNTLSADWRRDAIKEFLGRMSEDKKKRIFDLYRLLVPKKLENSPEAELVNHALNVIEAMVRARPPARPVQTKSERKPAPERQSRKRPLLRQWHDASVLLLDQLIEAASAVKAQDKNPSPESVYRFRVRKAKPFLGLPLQPSLPQLKDWVQGGSGRGVKVLDQGPGFYMLSAGEIPLEDTRAMSELPAALKRVESLRKSLTNRENPYTWSDQREEDTGWLEQVLKAAAKSGLEEKLEDLLLEEMGAIPVQTLAEVDGRSDDLLYLIQRKPTLAQLRRFLNSRRREYGIYAFVADGKPRLLVQAGKENKLPGIDRYLARVFRKHGVEVPRIVEIHNHNQGTAIPSRLDFLYDLDRYYHRDSIETQDFVYSRSSGRLLEFGNGKPEKERPASLIRVQIWDEKDQDPRVTWIPWNRARAVYNGRLDSYLNNWVPRRADIFRMEVDDHRGRWIRWERGVTLKSILREIGVLSSAAGLEEEGEKRSLSKHDLKHQRNKNAVAPWHAISLELLDRLIFYGGEDKTPVPPKAKGVYRFENKGGWGGLTHTSTLREIRDWVAGDSQRGISVRMTPRSDFKLWPIQLRSEGELSLGTIPLKLENAQSFLAQIQNDNPFNWAAGLEEPSSGAELLERAVARAEEAVDQGQWQKLEKAAFALFPLQGQRVSAEIGGPNGEVWGRLNRLVQRLQQLKAADAFENREDPRIQRWQVEAVALLFSAEQLSEQTVDAILTDLSISGPYLWATLYRYWGRKPLSPELVFLMDAMVVLLNVLPQEQEPHWEEVEEAKTLAISDMQRYLFLTAAVSSDDFERKSAELGWISHLSWNKKIPPIPDSLRRDFLLRRPEAVGDLSGHYRRFISFVANTLGFREDADTPWELLSTHLKQMGDWVYAKEKWDSRVIKEADWFKILSARLVSEGLEKLESRLEFLSLHKILAKLQEGGRPTDPEQLRAVRLWEANALALLEAVSTSSRWPFSSQTAQRFLEDSDSLEGEFWNLLYIFSRFMNPPQGRFADPSRLEAIEFLIWSTPMSRFAVPWEQLPPAAQAGGVQLLADSIRSVPGQPILSQEQKPIPSWIQQPLFKAFLELTQGLHPSVDQRLQFLLGTDGDGRISEILRSSRAEFLAALADRIGWFYEGEKWADWKRHLGLSAGLEEKPVTQRSPDPGSHRADRVWVQEADPAEAIPPSFRGKAIHFDYMNIAQVKPREVSSAAAILIDFDRFQQGLALYRPYYEQHDQRAAITYAKQVIRFLGNLSAVKTVIFYNVSKMELVINTLLRVRNQKGLNLHWDWLVDKPIWVFSGTPELSSDRLLVDVSVQVQDKFTATVSFEPAASAAGLEESPTDEQIRDWVEAVKEGSNNAVLLSEALPWLGLPDIELMSERLLRPGEVAQPWFDRARFLEKAVDSLEDRIAVSQRAHQTTRRILEEFQKQKVHLDRNQASSFLFMRLTGDLINVRNSVSHVSEAVVSLIKEEERRILVEAIAKPESPVLRAEEPYSGERTSAVSGLVDRMARATGLATELGGSLSALLKSAGVKGGSTGPATQPEAGLEEGVGYVAVEGVGLLVPAGLSSERYYVVAIGPEQVAALVAAGRNPRRIVAVASGLEEVGVLTMLGVPGDQIVRAWNWPTLEAAKSYAIRLGREWLAGLNGLSVSVLEVTANSLQGILAQLRELLPSAWQALRPVDELDAQDVLKYSV